MENRWRMLFEKFIIASKAYNNTITLEEFMTLTTRTRLDLLRAYHKKSLLEEIRELITIDYIVPCPSEDLCNFLKTE